MNIKSLVYMGSFAYDQPFPPAIGSEVVFIGRSNVGKSSVINALLGRRNIARTSNTPGKTRTANFYAVNDAFCFVDVPGYGYAKVSKSERAQWRKLIASYLKDREALVGIVHVIDIRHSPSEKDESMSKVLRESGKPVCIIFNKRDKIKAGRVDGSVAAHLRGLDVASTTAVVPFSAETGSGKKPLWAWLGDVLSL